MTIPLGRTQTNSSIGAFLNCPREHDLAYNLQLEWDGPEKEVFTVGTAWHVGHEFRETPERWAHIRQIAPSPLWGEKLCTLAAAYDWYWNEQPLEFIHHEFQFRIEIDGVVTRGQIDGVVRMPDERVGIIEFKTTSESLDGKLLEKLRLDRQVGLYALACKGLDFFPNGSPDFIIYDVTRKPSINPKSITKAEAKRMRKELEEGGSTTYFGLTFGGEIEPALREKREDPALYAARLRADIGDRPAFYFARREVTRTKADFKALAMDLRGILRMMHDIEVLDADQERAHYPRNDRACFNMGTCQFHTFCGAHVYPEPGEIPDGFRRREHRHPELDGKPSNPA